MTETSPAPTPAGPESFPEFDAPAFVPPAPSPVLNATAPKVTSEPVKVAETTVDAPAAGDAPATDAPAGPKPDEVPAADEAAEPEPGPFQFAGRTFKDSAAAEHYLKTQEGRAKAEAKHGAEIERKLEEATRAANYYKAEAEKKAQTPEKITEPAKEKPKSWLEDQQLWTEVRKLAEEEGIDAAMYHALQKAEGHISKAYEAKLEAELAPFKKAEAATKLKDYTTALFEAAENFADAKDAPVYPELRDPKAYTAVVRIWSNLDPAFALTERGVDYAVLRYRAEQGGAPAPPKPLEPSGAAAPIAETLARAANPAPESLNGGGAPRPALANDAAARSKRVLGDGGRPRLTPSGESLGFID